MKNSFLIISILFGLAFFTSCEKENIDVSEPEVEDIIPEDVQCNLTIEILEQTSGRLIAGSREGAYPITFLWSTGETTQSITPAESGTYAVTATDANGCTSESEILVCVHEIEVSLDLSINTEATAIVTGGNPPFTYAWSTGDVGNVTHFPTSISYTLTVTDAEGCSVIEENSALVPEPCGKFSWMGPVVSDCEVTEFRVSSHSLYDFEWSTGETSHTIPVSEGITYSSTITNTYFDCIEHIGFTYAKSVNCPGFIGSVTERCPGELRVNPVPSCSAGVSPVLYEWNTGDTIRDIDVFENGLYFITITDGNGCTIELSHLVSNL